MPLRIPLDTAAGFVRRNTATDAFGGMAQGSTHAVHKYPGKGSLHLFCQLAGFFSRESMPAQYQTQDTVAAEQKFRVGCSFLCERDRAIGGMVDQTCGFEFPHCFGDGGGIDMKRIGQIHGFYASPSLQNISQIFTAPGGYLAPGEIIHGNPMGVAGSYVLPGTKFFLIGIWYELNDPRVKGMFSTSFHGEEHKNQKSR
jgi:hypothetical protein